MKFDYDRFWQIRSKKKNGKKQKKSTGNRYLMRIQPRGRVNVLISTTWAQLEVAFWGQKATNCSMPRPFKRIPEGAVGGKFVIYVPIICIINIRHIKSAFICCSIHTISHCYLFGRAELKHWQLQLQIQQSYGYPLPRKPLSYCHCQTIVS